MLASGQRRLMTRPTVLRRLRRAPCLVSDPVAARDLRDAFALIAPRVTQLTPSDLSMLQERVCAVVDEMKATGVLPERIIVSVRRIAADFALDWHGELFDKLIGWCVHRYYAGDDVPPAAS